MPQDKNQSTVHLIVRELERTKSNRVDREQNHLDTIGSDQGFDDEDIEHARTGGDHDYAVALELRDEGRLHVALEHARHARRLGSTRPERWVLEAEILLDLAEKSGRRKYIDDVERCLDSAIAQGSNTPTIVGLRRRNAVLRHTVSARRRRLRLRTVAAVGVTCATAVVLGLSSGGADAATEPPAREPARSASSPNQPASDLWAAMAAAAMLTPDAEEPAVARPARTEAEGAVPHASNTRAGDPSGRLLVPRWSEIGPAHVEVATRLARTAAATEMRVGSHGDRTLGIRVPAFERHPDARRANDGDPGTSWHRAYRDRPITWSQRIDASHELVALRILPGGTDGGLLPPTAYARPRHVRIKVADLRLDYELHDRPGEWQVLGFPAPVEGVERLRVEIRSVYSGDDVERGTWVALSEVQTVAATPDDSPRP